MQKYYDSFLKVLIGATLFVPLLVFPSSYIFPFIVPKALVFRSLALLMLGTYILLVLKEKDRYSLRSHPIHIAVALYFACMAISTFVGVDWYKSFWDGHERMLGLFTIFHYILYYYIVSAVATSWKDWRMFFRLFLFSGLLVMIIGVIQRYDNSILLGRSSRIASTLGNSIYVGGYGIFLIFSSFLLYFKEKKAFWKRFALITAFFALLGMVFSETRGSLVGLAAGIGFILVTNIFLHKEKKKIKQASVGIIIAGLVGIGLLFSFSDSALVQNVGVLRRLSSVSFTTGTGGARLMAWEIAFEGFQEKPVFGWGLNNYYYAFNKYYNPAFLKRGWGETWFDNAHNEVMNTLATGGIFGLAAYLSLFIVPIVLLARAYRKKDIDAVTMQLLIAFLIAHFVHNLFVFENLTSYLYLTFILAYIYFLTAKKIEMKNKTVSLGLPVQAIVFAIVLYLVYTTNVLPGLSNMKTLQAMKEFAYVGGNPIGVYEQMKEIKSPHIDDNRGHVARTIAQAIPKLMETPESKRQAFMLFELAVDELEKNLEIHPKDIRTGILLVEILQLGTNLTGDRAYLLQAEKIGEEMLSYSPKRQQIQYSLALVKDRLGKKDESFALYTSARDNTPEVAETWWRIALFHAAYGEPEKVEAVLQEAQDNGVVFSSSDQKIIQDIRNIVQQNVKKQENLQTTTSL